LSKGLKAIQSMSKKTTFQLRSAARKSGAMPDIDPYPGGDLTDWLQEVAKRPWVSGPPSINPAVLPEAGPKAIQEPRLRRHLRKGRDLVALSVLTITYLQYYYLDVMVQIGSLPKLVVFVPLAAA
jgi:hypothetical protein